MQRRLSGCALQAWTPVEEQLGMRPACISAAGVLRPAESCTCMPAAKLSQKEKRLLGSPSLLAS